MPIGTISTGKQESLCSPEASITPAECPVALVGAGVFVHNLHKVFGAAGCRLSYVVDEFKTGSYLGVPLFKAEQLDVGRIDHVDKFVIGISMPQYREAAVERLLRRGVPRQRIFQVEDDATIPILSLIFQEYGAAAIEYFRSVECSSVYDLEKHFYGADWERGLASLDPAKKTIGFCYYGRGGGFRRHLRGLIPRLKERFNILTLMDERLPSEEPFRAPELYMSPGSAMRFEQMDLAVTAHFIPCCTDRLPKVNFLHTSFDFILEPEWLIERFDAGDPHYIFTSTRATLEWLAGLARRGNFSHRLCLIPGGYTRLDDNLRHAEAYAGPVDSLIYAPTLSLNAVRNHHLTYSIPQGKEIVEALLENFPQHKVIFRPHPNDLQLLKSGRNDDLAQPFQDVLRICDEHPRCILDGSSTFYMDSYNASAVMISDTSSTAYTYALSTLRPAVFFSPHNRQVMEVMGQDSAFIRDRERIGAIAQSAEQMVSQVRDMLNSRVEWQDRIRRYRQEVCFNIGRTEEYFVENLDYILEGRKHPDWIYFNW